jgi:hypothetical protein
MATLDHTGIFGQSKSGKSFVGQARAKALKAKGIPVLVCDAFKDPSWNADFFTDDIEELVKVAKRSKSCAIFVDEAGQNIGLHPSKDVEWLTTGARHWGHVTHLLGQRSVMVNRTMRDQLDELFLFNVNPDDAKDWALIFNDRELLEASKLPRHIFYHKLRHQPARLRKLQI